MTRRLAGTALLFLASAAVQAQGSTLPVTFVQTAPLPGENAGSPPMGALISSGEIVNGDAAFTDKLAAILALTESRGYPDDPILMQAVTSVGLRWLLDNRESWAGHETAVARILGLHASNGGVMFAEMVDVVRALTDRIPTSDLGRLRSQVVAAYVLRADEGDSDFVVDPSQFQERMRTRVEAEAERQRVALDTVARWRAEGE